MSYTGINIIIHIIYNISTYQARCENPRPLQYVVRGHLVAVPGLE